MSPLTIALLCTGLLLLVIILWVIVSHNGFVRLRNLVQEAWRQIDVELNRRHDLIPNLLETVRGYMSYEQSTLQAVVEARRLAEAPAANLAQRARNEDALSGALSRLIALSENYPTLRADSSFLQLQQELTNTEDRIAAGRRFYNSNVRDLNTKCEKFPSLIIASIFHFRHAEYFEVHDEASRAVPQVSFGGQPQPGQGSPYGGPTPGQAGQPAAAYGAAPGVQYGQAPQSPQAPGQQPGPVAHLRHPSRRRTLTPTSQQHHQLGDRERLGQHDRKRHEQQQVPRLTHGQQPHVVGHRHALHPRPGGQVRGGQGQGGSCDGADTQGNQRHGPGRVLVRGHGHKPRSPTPRSGQGNVKIRSSRSPGRNGARTDHHHGANRS